MNYYSTLLELIKICSPILAEATEKWSNGNDCYQSAYNHLLATEIKVSPDYNIFRLRLKSLGIDVFKLNNERLICIDARVKGIWDNPYLKEFGALLPDTDADIKRIAQGLGGVD